MLRYFTILFWAFKFNFVYNIFYTTTHPSKNMVGVRRKTFFEVLHIESPKFITIKSDYRLDFGMWEKSYSLFNIIVLYKYSIRSFKTEMKLKVNYSIFQKRNNQKRYLPEIVNYLLPVGKQEFKELYRNNKWLVPVNKTLRLHLD